NLIVECIAHAVEGERRPRHTRARGAGASRKRNWRRRLSIHQWRRRIGWPPSWAELLERKPDRDEPNVTERAPEKLDPHRQTVRRETSRNAERGEPGLRAQR